MKDSTLDHTNFREFARDAIKKYADQGMILDAMIWGRVIGHYEAAVDAAAERATQEINDLRITLAASDSRVVLLEHLVAAAKPLMTEAIALLDRTKSALEPTKAYKYPALTAHKKAADTLYGEILKAFLGVPADMGRVDELADCSMVDVSLPAYLKANEYVNIEVGTHDGRMQYGFSIVDKYTGYGEGPACSFADVPMLIKYMKRLFPLQG